MSMSPLHGGVLGGAAVVASPALWLSLVDGTLPLSDALTRYLLSVVICWVALNVVAAMVLVEPSPKPARQEAHPDQETPAGA
ncbi:hypothetical protein [Nocardioides houyundeii]|uniref:hypothetical protein n=1 Tax=Nocardioides houyundeii TaxID=2045452 RepID=UPI0013155B7C|nr:hypothetical protein [Nocardioides houyundeii]